jgi:hypothetical protein
MFFGNVKKKVMSYELFLPSAGKSYEFLKRLWGGNSIELKKELFKD